MSRQVPSSAVRDYASAVEYTLGNISEFATLGAKYGSFGKALLWKILSLEWVDADGGRCFALNEHQALTLLHLASEDIDAFELLSSIGAVNVQSCGPLPRSLRLFIALEMGGSSIRPPTPKNRKADDNWSRDFHIIHHMILLPKLFGIPRVRNDSRGDKGVSAADAICEAFAKSGAKGVGGLSHKAVEKVWEDNEKRRRYSVLTKSGNLP